MKIDGKIEISGEFAKDALEEYIHSLPGQWAVLMNGDKIILVSSYEVIN